MPQICSRSRPAGESPIEKLPSELLIKILMSVNSLSTVEFSDSISQSLPGTKACTKSFMEIHTHNLIGDPNAKVPPSPCLLPCLLTSRTLLSLALPVMYRYVEVSRLSVLEKVLNQITKHPVLGASVRRLGLSNFCRQTNASPFPENPLLEALSRTPLLREFRVNNSMEHFLDLKVLQKVFYDLPYLETLDLSRCNSSTFVDGCSALLHQNREITKSIRSLSLEGCSDLPPEFFESLLPQLPSLQYLDVSNTQITCAALSSISMTAKLIHLNINHCYDIEGNELAEFLANHSSTRGLVYLSMEMSAETEQHTLGEEEISKLLSSLPSTLRILNLKNSAMTSADVPLLRGLLVQLEELSVGAPLRWRDIEKLVFDFGSSENEELQLERPEDDEAVEVDSKYQTVLSPMEDAIAVCKLRQRINSYPEASPSKLASQLKYLDISSLPHAEQGKIRTSILLGPQSMPLEVIEISEKVLKRWEVLPKLCAAVGWELKSVGRRCWMRRKGLR